jgi:hypothetical protein
MEPRFGHDFGKVRVHTDARAAESARAIQSIAYTLGKNIAFGSGHYTPETERGKRLVAHELVHVLQQERAGYSRVQGKPDDGEGTAHHPNPESSPSQKSGPVEPDYCQRLREEREWNETVYAAFENVQFFSDAYSLGLDVETYYEAVKNVVSIIYRTPGRLRGLDYSRLSLQETDDIFRSAPKPPKSIEAVVAMEAREGEGIFVPLSPDEKTRMENDWEISLQEDEIQIGSPEGEKVFPAWDYALHSVFIPQYGEVLGQEMAQERFAHERVHLEQMRIEPDSLPIGRVRRFEMGAYRTSIEENTRSLRRLNCP